MKLMSSIKCDSLISPILFFCLYDLPGSASVHDGNIHRAYLDDTNGLPCISGCAHRKYPPDAQLQITGCAHIGLEMLPEIPGGLYGKNKSIGNIS